MHFFFIVSGMLMTNSIMKRDCSTESPGKAAMSFVLHKFKPISGQYYVALFISAVVYIGIYESLDNPVRIFPELFLLQLSGVTDLLYNSPLWYLSAMILCMLPLAYMLFKKEILCSTCLPRWRPPCHWGIFVRSIIIVS